MAFQPVPGTVKAAIVGENQGELNVNTLFFEHVSSGVPPSADIEGLASNLLSHWESVMLNSLPLTYILRSIEVTGLWAAVAPAILLPAPDNTTGELAGPVAPNNVSLAIKFSTGLTGRGSRGRNFWPGFLELEVNNNRVDEARASAITAGYSDLIGAGVFHPKWTWVVVSRTVDGAPRPSGTRLPITSVSVTDTVVDSMRRRLPKRGV